MSTINREYGIEHAYGESRCIYIIIFLYLHNVCIPDTCPIYFNVFNCITDNNRCEI